MFQREVEVLIIQTCKFILLIIFFALSQNVFSKEKLNDLEITDNFSGNYLSWIHAKKNGDPDGTSKFLNLITQEVTDNELLVHAFYSSLLLNDWEISEKLARKIVLFDKHNFIANIILSTSSFKKEKFVESINFIENIESSIIDKSFIKIIKSWIYLQSKNNDMALEHFKDQDCMPINCLHSALINKQIGENQIAKSNFDKILEKSSLSLRLTEVLYSFYSKNNNSDELLLLKNKFQKNSIEENFFSQRMLNDVITPQDGLSEIYFNISGWFYERNLYKFSIYFSNIGLTLRPNFQALKLLAANSYEQLDLLEYSIDKIKDIDPTSIYFSSSVYLKTSILNETGKNKELINFLKNLSNTYKDDERIEILLADTLRNEGLYKDSLTIYNKIINRYGRLEKQKYYLFYSRGITFERLKRWNKAEKDFLTALELKPNDPFILNYIGYSWLERKINIKKALKFILIAAEQEPQDAYIIDSLGWAYYLTGDFKKSIDILELAVTLSPNDATLNDHLGDAYWKDGRTREALSQWKRILVIDPDFEKIKEVKNKIATGL